MWSQNYTPLADSIPLSAFAAGVPLYVLFYLLAVRKMPAHWAGVIALAVTLATAILVFEMPAQLAFFAALMGAAFAIFPIMWIVLNALFIYNLTVATGHFEVLRGSVAALSEDQRLQALLIAFSFGALIEGIAGFGTPVALSAAMLVGVGFTPFSAVTLALLANTAPVAFGNLGIPIVSLGGVIQPFVGGARPEIVGALSAMVGRQVPMLSLVVPVLLVTVLAGWRRTLEVLPGVLAVGVSFAATQFVVANYLGPVLADVAAALVAILALLALLRFWRPPTIWRLSNSTIQQSRENPAYRSGIGETLVSWSPYIVLVIVVTLGNVPAVSRFLDQFTVNIPWPGLHNQITRLPPLVAEDLVGTEAALVSAIYTFDWLRVAGTLTLLAGLFSALILRVRPRRGLEVYLVTARSLIWPTVGVISVLALAWVMNYSGMTVTLGLFFTITGALFPFFSAIIGWIGVFLTGSDTASNNLFGGLQVTTAELLGIPEVLAAGTNSSGGVCAKMISPQNLAIGAASVGLSGQEGTILRRTVAWSLALLLVVGLIALAQAYLLPQLIPSLPVG